MILVADTSFKRAFKRLIKKNSSLENKIRNILKILENDPFTASLKTHKLTGNLDNYWSCSINYEYRIIFKINQTELSEQTLIILVDIGTHDEVY
ncbi:type II toxin-antitoxin system mRNA interferase toxin, RelE/StbE family [Geminocystis sp. GBBB08]|uniref:type II toxin-antitoxin system RelE/ParE family toxin n=1 Tax=Geminocystis sp. GBBB08 TaxID=2604140 RepID=UPI0027E31B9E|nr:type II toxin-antitoxin system mRNA interferase toxin, RelE/StbE family [Geminocystis sp. GBBB08]MBL1211242.1 type II toxin-antitoxin system mRNA interferase toxin, RelE/StbE family [Geminocystis sp. GBBB08]